MREYVEAGADTVLAKPIKADTLDRIMDLMERDGPHSLWRSQRVIVIDDAGAFSWHTADSIRL